MKSKKLAYNKILVLFSIIVVSVLMTGCNEPIVLDFSASPSTINQGESSTLTWDVSKADTVTITPDLGVGAVGASGSISISPGVTTTYTLIASNSAGSTTASVTVTVVIEVIIECIDFESLTIGKVYNVEDTFTDSGVTITVVSTLPIPLPSPSGGFAQVVDDGCAGASGKEINVNNVNLGFNFSGPLKGLSLNFGAYGGNLNIEINDDFQNFENFDDINGTIIGGVSVKMIQQGPIPFLPLNNVSVIDMEDPASPAIPDDPCYSLILSGEMGMFDFNGQDFTFVIGGQELCIDHVCWKPGDEYD